MAKNRLTEAQIRDGEGVLRGAASHGKAWGKVRGRLTDWQALLDLSVREAVLAAAENGDPYILYELARETVERMEPWMRVRLQRDLHELLKRGADIGVRLGTLEWVPPLGAIPLLRLLAARPAWNERTELKPKVKKELDFSPHRTTRLLNVLEGNGSVRRWTKKVKSKGRGRPRKVPKVALTKRGRAVLRLAGEPDLGPGKIRRERYLPPFHMDEEAARRVEKDLAEIAREAALKAQGM